MGPSDENETTFAMEVYHGYKVEKYRICLWFTIIIVDKQNQFVKIHRHVDKEYRRDLKSYS